MVFFTCNHCGESVKKPSVEKHYSTKCRNGIFVSCMDCLKDFRDDYVEHTKCISEAKKYSGKDYVEKERPNCRQKKQESWVEIVRSILDTKEFEVSPAVRGIFQKLQNYENVPRKKSKFENFVSNSMRVRRDQAEAVWNVLEKGLDKLNGRNNAKQKQTSENESNAAPSENGKLPENATQRNGEDKVTSTNEAEGGDCDKKKKSKRSSKNPEQTAQETEVTASDEVPAKSGKKSKKKRSLDIAQEISCEDTTSIEQLKTETSTNGEEASSAVITNGDAEVTSTDNGQQNGQKKRKKQKKSDENPEQSSEQTEEAEIVSSSEALPKKSKKKRTLDASHEDEGAADKKQKLEDQPISQNFDWTETIFNILGNSNEISVDKLKAKVLKKYKALHQVEEVPLKVEKTFAKMLKKSGLFVENNVVKTKLK